VRLGTSQLAHAESILREIESEMGRRQDGYETAVRAAFLALVVHLCRCYADRAKDRTTPVTRMAKVVSHIRTSFRSPLCIPDLATMADLSSSQFRRSFRQLYAMSPLGFIERLRIEEACALLADLDRPIAEVGRVAGFSTAPFFITRFRRATGQTPGQYRKALLRAAGPERLLSGGEVPARRGETHRSVIGQPPR
jgi:AraC-like DNA-binding protein